MVTGGQGASPRVSAGRGRGRGNGGKIIIIVQHRQNAKLMNYLPALSFMEYCQMMMDASSLFLNLPTGLACAVQWQWSDARNILEEIRSILQLKYVRVDTFKFFLKYFFKVFSFFRNTKTQK